MTSAFFDTAASVVLLSQVPIQWLIYFPSFILGMEQVAIVCPDCLQIPRLHRTVFLLCFDTMTDSDSRTFALLWRVFFADSLSVTLLSTRLTLSVNSLHPRSPLILALSMSLFIVAFSFRTISTSFTWTGHQTSISDVLYTHHRQSWSLLSIILWPEITFAMWCAPSQSNKRFSMILFNLAFAVLFTATFLFFAWCTRPTCHLREYQLLSSGCCIPSSRASVPGCCVVSSISVASSSSASLTIFRCFATSAQVTNFTPD